MAATYPPGPPPMMATSYSAPLDMNRTAAHPAPWVRAGERQPGAATGVCVGRERDQRRRASFSCAHLVHLAHPCARGCAPCVRLGCCCEASANRAHARTTEPGTAPSVRLTVLGTRDSRTVHVSGSGVRQRVRNSGVRSRGHGPACALALPARARAPILTHAPRPGDTLRLRVRRAGSPQTYTPGAGRRPRP